jgi:diguanylate cyclase (GGDEF)-like protein
VNTDPLRDAETGLYNEAFFRASLPTRVAMARRLLRPISITLLALGDAAGVPGQCTPDTARRVAYGLLDSLRESDTPCRLENGGFAVILEDTPENGAVWTVERLRRSLAEQGTTVTTWAGIASYPAHALEAPSILAKAQAALDAALEWPQFRIEVALPDH